MNIFTSNKLSSLVEQNKRLSEEILPELIKRLILSSCHDNLSSIRIPDKDDIWAPGFDGIVECDKHTLYVCEGKSIWEFGTNHDSLQKINDDYQKRVNNPLGINIAETSFYLVIPKIWAFNKEGKSITDWENEKRKDGWKDIKVYDASILSDWINSEPAVCAWLNEQYYHESLNFSSVNQAWHIFSNKTKPCFTEKMFIEDREREKDFFQKLLKTKTRPSSIKIKSESLIDSQGFILSSLQQDNDLKETVIVINNKETYYTISREVSHKILFLNFYFNGDLNLDDNTVILAFNKEAVSIIENIKLPPLFRDHYVKALIDMGFSEGDALQHYSATHGNLPSLIRKIPSTAIIPIPDWAKDSEKNLLMPLLFLRYFSQKNKVIVNKLSEGKNSEIERKFKEYLKIEDSPIKKVGNLYILVNYEETWTVLKPEPMDGSFSLLSNVILEILEEINITGNCEWIDITLRPDCQFAYLLQNLIYFSIDSESSHEIQSIIRRILVYAYNNNTKRYILNNLHILAEAMPKVILNFIQKDLKNENGIINSIINSDPRHIQYTNILFALDILVLDKETNIDACLILFDLYPRDKDFSLGKYSKDSLLDALCLSNVYGTLTLDQKFDLIHLFIQKNQDLGIQFAIELINQYNYNIPFRYKTYEKQQLLKNKRLYVLEKIATNILETAYQQNSVFLIFKLIKNFYKMSPRFWTSQVENFIYNKYPLTDIAKLNYEFRSKLYKIKEVNLEKQKSYIDVIKLWIEKTSISDSPYSMFWIFTNYTHCPLDELLKYDKASQEYFDELLKIRQQTFLNVLKTYGLNGVFSLLDYLNDDIRWGLVLSVEKDFDILTQICSNLIKLSKKQILYGTIDYLEKDQAKKIFDSLSNDTQLELLSTIQRKDISDWLTSDDLKSAYWKNKFISQLDKDKYAEILHYNPNCLIFHCHELAEQNIQDNIKIIKEVFSAISNNNSENSQNIDCLEDVIEIVDKEYYDDEWATICIKLYDLYLRSEIPNCIRKYFFLHPEIFLEHIQKSKKSNRYIFYYSLPTIAFENYELFKHFCDILYTNSQKDTLGNILAKNINNSNNYSPHDYIKKYIEEKHDYELCSNISIVIYTETDYTSSDGQDCLKLAEQFKILSQKYKIQYPMTADILQAVSENLETEAKEKLFISETR